MHACQFDMKMNMKLKVTWLLIGISKRKKRCWYSEFCVRGKNEEGSRKEADDRERWTSVVVVVQVSFQISRSAECQHFLMCKVTTHHTHTHTHTIKVVCQLLETGHGKTKYLSVYMHRPHGR